MTFSPFPKPKIDLEGVRLRCRVSDEWWVDTRVGLCKYKLYVHLIRVPKLLEVDWVSLSTQCLLGADTRRALGCDPRDTEKCKGVYRDSWTGVYTHHVCYNSKNMEVA